MGVRRMVSIGSWDYCSGGSVPFGALSGQNGTMSMEAAVVQALFQRGWAVNAGERYRVASPPAIRVTVATLLPRDAARFAGDLAEIIGQRGARA